MELFWVGKLLSAISCQYQHKSVNPEMVTAVISVQYLFGRKMNKKT